MATQRGRVHRDRLVLGLAAVFAGLTVVLVVLAAVTRSVVPAVVAVALGAAAGIFWYHATGRLEAGIYGRARRRDRRRRSTGAGAGPRGDWAPPGGWERWERRDADRTGGRRATGGGGDGVRADGLTAREARRVLGVDADADEAAVRTAYRERVKEVHPDRGGDEAAFRRVNDAYERLTE